MQYSLKVNIYLVEIGQCGENYAALFLQFAEYIENPSGPSCIFIESCV